MSEKRKQLLIEIEPNKQQLFTHSLYEQLNSLESLKVFMSYHVFAVWDFMNLLTYLQSQYTCCQPPWSPPQYPKISRLINEIKLEEESDRIDGQICSHFSYYVQSMKALQIDTSQIERFIQSLGTCSYSDLIQQDFIPNSVQSFLKVSKLCIDNGPVSTAASFTFGRETIIPDMFIKVLANIETNKDIEPFKQYLERHIELDGNEHSNLALELISQICGDDDEKWQTALDYAKLAIDARIQFYSDLETKVSR